MARPFLNEQISVEAGLGSNSGEAYSVLNVTTSGGNSYGALRSPYPIFSYDLSYNNRNQDFTLTELVDLYHRSGGTFGGFRVKNWGGYTTNDYVNAPTSFDQLAAPMAEVDQFQMIRWYGAQGDLSSTRRIIRKPVIDTVKVAISGFTVVSDFTTDYDTGVITFEDNARFIGGITQAAQAVVTTTLFDNTFTVDDSVYVSGVVGMTEINDQRFRIVAVTTNTITLAVNSTGFTPYVSGGGVATRPQTDSTIEPVTFGCEFDIPMRFEDDLDGLTHSQWESMSVSLNLVELLNP